MPSSHDPISCASVDHRYWTYTVIWCPHRQHWELRRSTYLETGTDDDPANYRSEHLLMGPFDGPPAVVARLVDWITSSELDFDPGPPRLPG